MLLAIVDMSVVIEDGVRCALCYDVLLAIVDMSVVIEDGVKVCIML